MSECECQWVQCVTIRFPDCPGQIIFGSGNPDWQKNYQNYILISYKLSKFSNFLNFIHTSFVIWASLGQVVLWPSLPDRATKKKENCRRVREYEWMNEWVNECVSEWVSEWVSGWVGAWFEWVGEWVSG